MTAFSLMLSPVPTSAGLVPEEVRDLTVGARTLAVSGRAASFTSLLPLRPPAMTSTAMMRPRAAPAATPPRIIAARRARRDGDTNVRVGAPAHPDSRGAASRVGGRRFVRLGGRRRLALAMSRQ